MITSAKYTNHLAQETSPYLLQHAHNPVDWYPWGAVALEKARLENKPILLSIGYSACHWCHVMAHESFEDPDTAALMNEHFVNIKVDREERPDLDKIYQTAHQIMTQRGGGWPLTMALTPQDQIPFFAGTYFPKTPRQGLISFSDLLQRLVHAHQHQQHEIQEHNQSLHKMLQSLAPKDHFQGQLQIKPLEDSREQLTQQYDAQYAGFGRAPKFPHPTHLEFLLRAWHRSDRQDQSSLSIVCTTLKSMGLGGLFDQVGGGFCRYSVDDRWMIPHFEKMLYDNACLLPLYIDAWQATGHSLYFNIAEKTVQWLAREMRHPQGAFYSAQDADSEGEEGKFYVWDKGEIETLLTDDEKQVFFPRYGFDKSPNFEGQWHLHTYVASKTLASRLQLPLEEVQKRIRNSLDKCFKARKLRIAPATDDKILTAWNGLLIKGLASAGRRANRQDWVQLAEDALLFIQQQLWKNGSLLVTWKADKASLNAYLDDYAFLAAGTLELLQCRWSLHHWNFLIALADKMLDEFEDKNHGGFFFTGKSHENLIQRPKTYMDDAIPSGNGIGVWLLARLGFITGEARYSNAAERALQNAWEHLRNAPSAHNALLLAVEETLLPPEIIILRGQADDLVHWKNAVDSQYHPRRICLAIPTDATDLPAALAAKIPKVQPLAYICHGQECLPPIETFDEFYQAMCSK